MSKINKTFYALDIPEFKESFTFALASDLHSQDAHEVIEILREDSPDFILMPGDIFDRLGGFCEDINGNGFELLRESALIAPSFYSIGNHENGGVHSWQRGWKKKTIPSQCRREDVERIEKMGVCFLDDRYVIKNGIAFGGLTSGLINEGNRPHLEWLDEFCSLGYPKILLCHHPEYYTEYLKDRDISLIVSGHAHGGQWRLFGRGVFAPGQGLFPKYTSGVHDGRFVVSKGLCKSGFIPRIFNQRELIFIKIN
ncbi:MAG: metallophosphoesterase [Clostridia bacterium]|nr:metallophosphoesterase [Clostridia bacterium]